MLVMGECVAQSCLALCDPRYCRLPGSSVHGILQARVLGVGSQWVGDLPDPEIKPGSPALLMDSSLPSEPQGNPSDGGG